MGYCSLINNNLYCVFYVLIKSDENFKKKRITEITLKCGLVLSVKYLLYPEVLNRE